MNSSFTTAMFVIIILTSISICVLILFKKHKPDKVSIYKKISKKLKFVLKSKLPDLKIINESDFMELPKITSGEDTNERFFLNSFCFSSKCYDLHRVVGIILDNFEKATMSKEQFWKLKESNAKIVSIKYHGNDFLISVLKRDHKFLIRIEILR